MKKVLTFTLLAAALFGACEKASNPTTHELSSNRVINIPADGKTAGSTILVMSIGHDGKTVRVASMKMASYVTWIVWEKATIARRQHLSIFSRPDPLSPPPQQTLLIWPRRIFSLCRADRYTTRMRKATTSSWTFPGRWSIGTARRSSSRSRGCSSATRRRTRTIRN